jgi:SOS response regulatory protein OraA/RecX
MPYEQLLKKALSLISRRRYTVLKIKKKLVLYYDKKLADEQRSKASNEEEAESQKGKYIKQVLTRLKELKYLDDTQFAKDFIESRNEFRPKGKFMLKRELKNKGLHPDLAERVVENTEIDEEANAIKALKKKIRQLEKESPRKQKEKAMRFLASRGFNIQAIYKAIAFWYNKSES